MTIATGISKQLRYKKESTWGTAPGASSAQLLRRLTSTLNLTKQTYKSNEIRADMQRADFRHGSRGVDGSIKGELSVGTYSDFIAAACRQAWQAVVTTGALTTISASSSGFARSSGSFLTAGFKAGDVCRASGFATSSLNARNFLVTSVTATNLNGVFVDGTTVATESAGATVTIVTAGKKTFVPTSSQTNDSFSIEHWHSDINQSELFTGCRLSQLAMNLPATGIADIDLTFMGKDVTTATSAYYTSPTAATTGTALAAVNGVVWVGGVAVANITGLNLTLNGNFTSGEVIGSNVKPDIFQGSVDVTGQITAYFQNATMRDLFINETEALISCVMTAGNTANADFMAVTLPRVKLGGSTKDDGEKGLIETLPFTAILQTAGGSGTQYDNTTISFMDSLAA